LFRTLEPENVKDHFRNTKTQHQTKQALGKGIGKTTAFVLLFQLKQRRWTEANSTKAKATTHNSSVSNIKETTRNTY